MTREELARRFPRPTELPSPWSRPLNRKDQALIRVAMKELWPVPLEFRQRTGRYAVEVLEADDSRYADYERAVRTKMDMIKTMLTADKVNIDAAKLEQGDKPSDVTIRIVRDIAAPPGSASEPGEIEG